MADHDLLAGVGMVAPERGPRECVEGRGVGAPGAGYQAHEAGLGDTDLGGGGHTGQACARQAEHDGAAEVVVCSSHGEYPILGGGHNTRSRMPAWHILRGMSI